MKDNLRTERPTTKDLTAMKSSGMKTIFLCFIVGASALSVQFEGQGARTASEQRL